jgi:transposase/IS5 family transposase
MLPQQSQLSFSDYSALYDIIVPSDNLLRKINSLIDFSFVYNELASKYCLDNGRTAECPVRMFKYLLLKTIYDLSDVDVVERSQYDLSFKFFLGMIPEEEVINPSSLCKFRKLRLKDTDLLNLLINKTVTLAIDKGIIKSKSIIVDATHTLSRSNPHSPLEVLKMRSKQLRKILYETDESIKDVLPVKNEDDILEHELAYTHSLVDIIKENETLVCIPKIKEKLNLLKETLEDIADHYTLSQDSDARIGHKSKEDSFFGYKTHIGMTEERIITAAVITSGEKGDGPQLPTLIDQSRQNGMEVETVIGDMAYSGRNNLEKAARENTELVSRLNPSFNGFRKEADRFDYNKDAGMYVCPAGHMAMRRAKHGADKGKCNRYYYYFDVEKCKVCSRKEGCYKEGAKSKAYAVSIKTDEQIQQMEFQQSERFKQKAKERYKIEAKNAELKNVYGYGRAQSYGLSCMQMQGAMAIFAANLKRILKLTE